ncbi:hypothetical protein Smp_091210 [Schistosoma mansoni]|uniref:WAPL domain-containing protein n=1 Tax=Schistosoma mansoni TaxID=6183 RepID=G4VRI3_SCHMA|nr:hypothetical protein Smp_091210 [Schistosoma mansoni]|eukprot:XP_018654252.1 hypothetical protein Smp_091210 [Schistosoma mansoni]
MANLATKMGMSGLRIGGRAAARQVSKQAAKEIAKEAATQAAKKAKKQASKKAVKRASKQSGRALKKTDKEETISPSKGSAENSIQMKLKSTERQNKFENSQPKAENTENTSLKLSTVKPKQFKCDENLEFHYSTRNDTSSKSPLSFVAKSKKTKPKLKFPTTSVLSAGPGIQIENTQTPAPITRRSTSPANHLKDISTTSADRFLELNQLQPKLDLETPSHIRKAPKSSTDFIRTVSYDSETEQPLSQSRQPGLIKVIDNNSLDQQNLKQYLHHELLKSEALSEVDDTEFNLMLLRLAKYLLMDVGETKDIKQDCKKTNKTSECLEALKTVLDSNALCKNRRRNDKKQEYSDNLKCNCLCSSTFPKDHSEDVLSNENYRKADEPVKENEYHERVDNMKKFKKYAAVSQMNSSSSNYESQTSSSTNLSEICRNIRCLEYIIRLLNNRFEEKAIKKRPRHMDCKRTKLSKKSSKLNRTDKHTDIQRQPNTSFLTTNLWCLTTPVPYYSALIPSMYEEPTVISNMLIDSGYSYFDEVYW